MDKIRLPRCVLLESIQNSFLRIEQMRDAQWHAFEYELDMNKIQYNRWNKLTERLANYDC